MSKILQSINTTVIPVTNCCKPECRALIPQRAAVTFRSDDGLLLWHFCSRCAGATTSEKLHDYARRHPELAVKNR